MSIPDRLRREARGIPATAPPELAARMRDLVAAQDVPPPAVAASHPRWSAIWALAAGLLLAASVVWIALSARTDQPDTQPIASRSLPAPPSLGDLLATAGAPQASQTVIVELAALSADLAAIAGTVRGSIPLLGP